MNLERVHIELIESLVQKNIVFEDGCADEFHGVRFLRNSARARGELHSQYYELESIERRER